MILLFLALLPAAVIIWYIYNKDKYEKEPTKLLLWSFFLGIMSIFPALIGSFIGTSVGIQVSENIFNTFAYAFIAVALSEEFAKFIFLRYILFNRKEFNEPFDGIIYGVMIGMGFAAFENILYVADGGMSVALIRMFTAVPAHAAFGVIMGYYIGLAKFNPENRNKLVLSGLLWAVLAHGAYDFFIMQKNYPALSIVTIIVLVFAIRFSKRAIAIHQKASPFHPDNIVQENLNAPDLNSLEMSSDFIADTEIDPKLPPVNNNPNSDIDQNKPDDGKWSV